MVHTNRSRTGFMAALFFLLIMSTIIGCATSKIPSLKHRPDCETSVEGYYYCVDPWQRSKPALIIRHGTGMKILTGEIMSQDAKGVTFKPKGEGYIAEPDPEYFKFKNIEALIDENGEVAYGIIPDQFSRAYALELHLTPRDDPESKPIKLVLEPNKQFGFCVPPGNYIVSEIQFRNDYQKMVDEGVDIPRLEVRVEENHSNYIGDIYMDCGDLRREDPIAIPYKIKHRPSEAMNDFIAGAAAGAIGAGLAAASGSSPALPKGVIGIHTIYIEENDEFAMKGKSTKINNIIIKKD